MHRIFSVQEILLEISGYCCEHVDDRRRFGKANLTSLARTCKAFKEPALDILWAELEDLTPLVLCLPGASKIDLDNHYSLKRPLDQADWDIILGFTRRVRICRLRYSFGLAVECIKELSKPPSSIASIFPKLCEIQIGSPSKNTIPFLQHLTGPRLVVIKLEYTRDVDDAIDTFGGGCPNIATFNYFQPVNPSNDTISSLMCRWSKLHSVQCHNVVLNSAALTHLSHMPSLHLLSFELHDAVIDCIQSTQSGPLKLTFPALIQYRPQAQSLATVLMSFDHLRFPLVKQLHVQLAARPTEQELESFLEALPGTCDHQSLIDIWIRVLETGMPFEPSLTPEYINFHHLCPLTVFVNIQTIRLRIPRGIDLSERELLRLASSWPHLEEFAVGWNDLESTASSAVTPGGFIQLLERCRSLSHFSFQFNTHDYTEVPQGHPWRGLKMRGNASIDVCLSPIEEDSVEALGIFFHVAPFPEFHLKHGWDRYYSSPDDDGEGEEGDQYKIRWMRVCSLAHQLWKEKDSLLYSLETRGQWCSER